MSTERIQTSLRFAGDWPWWAGLLLALLLAGGIWALYWREVRPLTVWWRWSMPALRSLAVVMIVLMLSGPVLHHRKVIGQLSRLLLFVDGSKSMDLADPGMDAGRKLRVAESLGLLNTQNLRMELPRAGEALSAARALAERAAASQTAEAAAWSQLLSAFPAKLEEARELLVKAGFPGDRVEEFAREIVAPARQLAGREMRQIDERQQAARDMANLATKAARWQGDLAAAFQQQLREMPGGGDPDLQGVLRRLEAMPRAERLQSLLLEGEGQRLLGQLARTHEVQLFDLQGSNAGRAWQSTGRDGSLPPSLPKAAGDFTDLATPLQTSAGSALARDQRAAVVLFSDGVGSSRVDLQACKLEYSIVSPK